MKKLLSLTLLFLAVTMVSSCKKDSHVCSVSLDKDTMTLTKGSTGTLVATVDLFGKAKDEGLTWVSSDPLVASVSETGVVTALEKGTALITVSPKADPDKIATCLVTVVVAGPPVTSITLDKTTLKLAPQAQSTLTATITPAAANQGVQWSSSNTAVATVSQGGVVSALTEGTATITAKAISDTTKKATCALTVSTAPSGFDNEGEAGIDGESWATAYEIATVEQLRLLATRVNAYETSDLWNTKHYVMTANIDFGDSPSDTWFPIGSDNYSNNKFQGYFDGGNFTVSGKLYARTSGSISSFGLFGTVTKATIKNLHFNGSLHFPTTSEVPFVGSIVGAVQDSTLIENCSNSSNIDAPGYVGGIVGNVSRATSSIIACKNSGTIRASTGSAGGISSANSGAMLVGCINTGATISSKLVCGGIASSGASVACWSTVTSLTSSDNNEVGTIVGRIQAGLKVKHCYWLEGDYHATNPSYADRVENSASFTGATPTPSQIANMNTEWATQQPNRSFRFNATTGEIEKITQ